MKSSRFKTVSFNNRKKQLEFTYTSGKHVLLHYSHLGIQQPIKEAWVDSETKGKSVGLRFQNSYEDFLPYDQPLAIVKDPEYLLQNQIEKLIFEIKEMLQKKKISKSYLAKLLHTSDNQIQRLLNPKILNKNLSQFYQVAALLGIELELHAKAA